MVKYQIRQVIEGNYLVGFTKRGYTEWTKNTTEALDFYEKEEALETADIIGRIGAYVTVLTIEITP